MDVNVVISFSILVIGGYMLYKLKGFDEKVDRKEFERRIDSLENEIRDVRRYNTDQLNGIKQDMIDRLDDLKKDLKEYIKVSLEPFKGTIHKGDRP